jgi:hypothetical protein
MLWLAEAKNHKLRFQNANSIFKKHDRNSTRKGNLRGPITFLSTLYLPPLTASSQTFRTASFNTKQLYSMIPNCLLNPSSPFNKHTHDIFALIALEYNTIPLFNLTSE